MVRTSYLEISQHILSRNHIYKFLRYSSVDCHILSRNSIIEVDKHIIRHSIYKNMFDCESIYSNFVIIFPITILIENIITKHLH